jgi:thiol:disulfide interchange protein DsbD
MTMKKILLLICICYWTESRAQHPAKWTFRAREEKNEAELQFKVDIEKDWHIYSPFTPEGGPPPMLLTFDSSQCFSVIEKLKEPKAIEEFDSVFATNVLYHVKEATFLQKVQIRQSPCRISGRIDYQACKEVCIPLDTTFTFEFGSGK